MISSLNIQGALNGNNEIFWQTFYNDDFDNAVELESAIHALIQQMQKMGL